MNPIVYLSEDLVNELHKKIESNLDRYRCDGFADRVHDLGWNIELEGREYDAELLSALDGTDRTATGDFKNSLIVGKVLGKLTPSEANEEQIWLRLSHIECVEYTRKRWPECLSDDDDKAVAQVEKHFFAKGRTGIRDDHSISRLWWNYYAAKQYCPEDPKWALELILTSADTRSAIIERPWMAIRVKLMQRILRALDKEVSLRSEENFRNFIKNVNRRGAGIIFEVMPEDKIDDFIKDCYP